MIQCSSPVSRRNQTLGLERLGWINSSFSRVTTVTEDRSCSRLIRPPMRYMEWWGFCWLIGFVWFGGGFVFVWGFFGGICCWCFFGLFPFFFFFILIFQDHKSYPRSFSPPQKSKGCANLRTELLPLTLLGDLCLSSLQTAIFSQILKRKTVLY